LEAVQQGSRQVDWILGVIPITLDPEEAYLHAMVPGSWVKKYGYATALAMSQKAYSKFIDETIGEAKRIYDSATDRSGVMHALYIFGMALHPIMDAESPAHGPWQIYDLSGSVTYDSAMLYVHGKIEERRPNAGEMCTMQNGIRDQLHRVVPGNIYRLWTTPRAP
jgi:hypothetical protein